MKKYLPILILCLILIPQLAGAQFEQRWGNILSCTGNYLDPEAPKYCSSLCDLLQTGKNGLDFFMTVLLFILAPAYFLYGGFLIMTSGGSEAKWGQAKDVMRRTVIGIILVLASYLIVATFLWGIGNTQGYVDESGQKAYVRWPNVACDPGSVPGGVIDTSMFQRAYDQKPTSNSIWACVANDGIWACGVDQASLSKTPACSGKSLIQIDASKCGTAAAGTPSKTNCDPMTNAGCAANEKCTLNIQTGQRRCEPK